MIIGGTTNHAQSKPHTHNQYISSNATTTNIGDDEIECDSDYLVTNIISNSGKLVKYPKTLG